MQKVNVPGMQLVYTKGRSVTSYALGVRQAGSEPTVTEATIFEAASLGKAVQAYLTLRLVDQGVLTLDKPLLSYAPYSRLQGAAGADLITTRMVLAHTSGLPNWAANPLSPEWTTSPLRLKYAPDSCWNYSGEGYVLLQKTLEQLTGQSFEALAQREVFQPLRMTHSSFTWHPQWAANVASGHDGSGKPFPINQFSVGYGAFSLLSTAQDYSRFLQALMTGRGLRPTTAQLLRTAASPALRCGHAATTADGFVDWACGVGLATTSRGLAQWQWGDNGNFKGLYFTLPDSRESLVFLTNSSNGPKMAPELLQQFFGPGEYRALQWLEE
ncbi:serine hydrolase domain-containing protein [Hymenobacter pini]|uniref:serine hydrolase domain-containing protein n=1 Tax=Hymenobacter pini TaxID=2880879 RepID=UPI001CF4049E|nr:serine hydrolase domain-containing protein [Hymenobacter pini]MCA8832306.1 beta-lactamase family protein [Hymenobacter pini]